MSVLTLTAADNINADGTGSAVTGTGGGGGPTFPGTNTILDDFNRANANPLDGNWTQGFQGTYDGTLKIVSNKVEFDIGNASGSATAMWNTSYNADQYASLFIDTRVGGSVHGLFARATGAGTSGVNGYSIQARTSSNDIRVHEWTSDLSANLLETYSQTISDGDSLAVSFAGTVGTVWYKVGAGAWTALSPTFNASTYNHAGKIGISLAISGTIADNFGGGNQ